MSSVQGNNKRTITHSALPCLPRPSQTRLCLREGINRMLGQIPTSRSAPWARTKRKEGPSDSPDEEDGRKPVRRRGPLSCRKRERRKEGGRREGSTWMLRTAWEFGQRYREITSGSAPVPAKQKKRTFADRAAGVCLSSLGEGSLMGKWGMRGKSHF